MLNKFFVEVVICPKFEKSALGILMKKKNLRLIETGNIKKTDKGYYSKKVVGGLLVQSRTSPNLDRKNLKVVSKRKPTDDEIKQMLFAFKVTNHVKSNSIVFVKNNATDGIGAGQMSMVGSSNIVTRKDGTKQVRTVIS